MPDFQLRIENRQVVWSEDQVELKLKAISNLGGSNRGGWIRKDLSILKSNWITRLFWLLIGKISYLRECILGVNLKKSKELMEQLKEQIAPQSKLLSLYNQAVSKIAAIVPSYHQDLHLEECNKEDGDLAFLENESLGSWAAPTLGPLPAKIPVPACPGTVSALMQRCLNSWSEFEKGYINLPFTSEAIREVLRKNNSSFDCIYDVDAHYGFIEKKVLKAGSRIFVRADLHGDLKSLVENVKNLQEQGLLNEQYCCRDDVHLVFLGDYMDRGANNLQVLELLLHLRLENPSQVTLLRGNHESADMNLIYSEDDNHYRHFLQEDELHEDNIELLESCYQTMPLALFAGQKTESKSVEYAMFTHGLFELYCDPYPLFAAESSCAQLVVSKERKFSRRVESIDFDPEEDYACLLEDTTDKDKRAEIKRQIAAKRIKELWVQDEERDHLGDYTTFNWGDMAEECELGEMESYLGCLGAREWKMSPSDVKHYLRLISHTSKVKYVFRGHEHEMKHHMDNDRIIVTTLPVGMETRIYSKKYPDQPDTAYVLYIEEKIKHWKKQEYTRAIGGSFSAISDLEPLQ